MSKPIIALDVSLIQDPAVRDQLQNLVAAIVLGFKNLDVAALGLANTGYKIARGQWLTATAADTIATGLTTVVVALGGLESTPVLGCDRAQAVVGTQLGAPAAGAIIIKTFRPNLAGDTTPIPATTFGKTVNWIAFGL